MLMIELPGRRKRGIVMIVVSECQRQGEMKPDSLLPLKGAAKRRGRLLLILTVL